MVEAVASDEIREDSLASRLAAGPPFVQAQLVALLAAVIDALSDAHRAGRFHGSLTPADIGFDTAGEVVLSGWGRDLTPDPMRATPYSPIESYAPVHPPGPWTDVYALGAIAWYATTGAPPAEVLQRKGDVSLARLAPAGFDPAFLRAVDAALEIAPQRRPAGADAWLEMFPQRPAPPIPAAPVEPAATVQSRPSWRWLSVASTMLGLGAVAAWLNATSTPVAPTEPAASPPPASPEPRVAETAVGSSPAAPPVVVVNPPVAAAPVAAPPTHAVSAPPDAARHPPSVALPVARSEPRREPPPEPAPAPEPDPPAGAVEVPRELLKRADRQLRSLFDDYGRMRAKVERSYDDDDILYGVKQRAYRESRRIQRELVELRDLRNRIARTGDVGAANRRYDELEVRAAEIRGRMDGVRDSL